MPDKSFSVAILAAQREGTLDPLAAEAGVSHKCLVPIGGKPLLAHVLTALERVTGIDCVIISVEADASESLSGIAAASSLPVRFTPAASNIADSVYVAAETVTGPLVVTTADNVLLTPEAVRETADRLLGGDDVVVALSRREAVLAAHPEAQRRFYKFADGEYSNCNLYGVTLQGLKLAEAFRSGGQFAKNPLRIARAFGIINLLIMRFGLVSIDGAMRRLSRRFKVRASALVLEDGAHAVDVDNARTYAIAAMLLERRGQA